ncbi:hypothetical protein PFISCL1PPCAC_29022, partial [Pristionchus fissidentatus]
RMSQLPAGFVETWNAEIDQIDRNLATAPGSLFDFDGFENDDQSMRRLREYNRQLAARAEAEDERMREIMSALDPLVRSRFCVGDYRQKDIAAHRARIEELRVQKENDVAMIKRFQRENASLQSRLATYEEDNAERVKMDEEVRRARMEESDRQRIQRNKLQQALDIAQGVSSPTVSQLRSRFDSPTTQARPQPVSSQTPQPVRKAMNNETGGGGPGFYNPKYRRSQSASRVVDHRPAKNFIPTGTILTAKSNPKATSQPKACQLRNSAGYVLTHQDIDESGNVATSIIKGDCIPTAGGGTAVCFNDIEYLTHEDPGAPIDNRRKSKKISAKKIVRF